MHEDHEEHEDIEGEEGTIEDEELHDETPEDGTMNETQIEEHLKIADANDDGKISYEEHYKYFVDHVLHEKDPEW